MFQLLAEYLFQFKKLFLPGTGYFSLEEKVAVNDLAAQAVEAPGWQIVFNRTRSGNNNDLLASELPVLYDWLATKMNISKEDAILKYDLFCDDLKAKLENNETVNWEGIGTLSTQNKLVFFTPDESAGSPFTGVTAKKVVREGANHTMLVGEKETTSYEMRKQLSGENDRPKSTATRLAWILTFAAAALLAAYFIKSGCNMQAAGNQEKIEVQKQGDTYRLK